MGARREGEGVENGRFVRDTLAMCVCTCVCMDGWMDEHGRFG